MTLDTAKPSYFRSFLGTINIVDEVGSGAACAVTCLCLIYGSSDLPSFDLMLKLLLGFFVVAIDIFPQCYGLNSRPTVGLQTKCPVPLSHTPNTNISSFS